jgi:hypothetical protein
MDGPVWKAECMGHKRRIVELETERSTLEAEVKRLKEENKVLAEEAELGFGARKSQLVAYNEAVCADLQKYKEELKSSKKEMVSHNEEAAKLRLENIRMKEELRHAQKRHEKDVSSMALVSSHVQQLLQQNGFKENIASSLEAITTLNSEDHSPPLIDADTSAVEAGMKRKEMQPPVSGFPYENERIPEKEKVGGSGKPAFEHKFEEVVRTKAGREALRGFCCEDCKEYYSALIAQGVYSEKDVQLMVQSGSRHRRKHTPPSTPEGYWDLSISTPEQWRIENEIRAKKKNPSIPG